VHKPERHLVCVGIFSFSNSVHNILLKTKITIPNQQSQTQHSRNIYEYQGKSIPKEHVQNPVVKSSQLNQVSHQT